MRRIIVSLLTVIMLVALMLPADMVVARGHRDRAPAATNQTQTTSGELDGGVTPQGILTGPSGWPTGWTGLSTDPADGGGAADHRDVFDADEDGYALYYAIDSQYIYLRMETVEPPGWPSIKPSGEARYKWWFNTMGNAAYVKGTTVYDAEFLLILEDLADNSNDPNKPRDMLGELTLMDDFNNEGFMDRWDSSTPPNYSINNAQTAPTGPSSWWRRELGTGTAGVGGPQGVMGADIGYRIDDTTTGGNFVDMYVSRTALGNPTSLCIIWATDNLDNNLDQAPNLDRPMEEYCLVLGKDFGDAPTPYPTLLADNGARHTVGNLYLGASVDAELDGIPNSTATGDDNDNLDDEDGVDFTASLAKGESANVTVTASAAGYLDAWLDFNDDGDWADAGEQIFDSALLSAGANDLNFSVPFSAAAGQTFARFRFSSAGGLSYDGLADDGEVEDYLVAIGACTMTVDLAGDTGFCEGGNITITATVTGGTPPYDYDWSGTAPGTDNLDGTFTATGSGTVEVIVTDDNGCTGSDGVQVTEYQLPACHITASPDTEVCDGTDVTLTEDGGDAVSWFWTTGETTSSIVVTTSDTYGVNITDANGCQKYCEITVTVYELPACHITASPDTEVCDGTDVTLTEDGGDAISWYWTTGETTSSIVVTITGTYGVAITDENGCEKNCWIDITVREKPVASASSNSPICEGVTIELYGGPDGMASYYWTGPGGWTSDVQNPTIPDATLDMAGTYTLTVTNEYGCTDDESTDVVVNENPVATASSNSPVNEGATIELYGGPNGMASYYWTGPDGFTSDSQNPTISDATEAMEGTYTLTVTNEYSCSDDATTTVVVNIPPPPAPAGGCPTLKELTVDWEGNNTTKPLYSNNKLAVDLLGPSLDLSHNLFLERGTHAPVVGTRTHYLIVVRKLEQIPSLPEDMEAIVVFSITPAGAGFDQDIFLTLGLDESQLPASALNVTMAYYDDINGVWVSLDYEAGGPSGVAELTLSAPINHFSIYGILAKLGGTPTPPAHFVPSNLTIVPSVEKMSAFVTRTGESVTITANIANDGGQEGTYTVVLKLNGQQIDTKTVAIAAGQSKQVTFTRSGLDYGHYDVDVAGLADEFTTSRTITWWLILLIILAAGLIIWGIIWATKRRKKAAQEEA